MEKTKIWSEFISKGKKFWIQSAEEEQFDEIAKIMTFDFLKDEPLSDYSKVLQDDLFVTRHRLSYYKTLAKGQSIICMTMDENNRPTIAGLHCQEAISYPKSEGEFRFGYSVLVHMLKFNDILTERGLKQFSLDRGLFVFSQYRGNGIGCELLKCWSQICKIENIMFGIGIFSSKYSQESAKRAGLIELNYTSYEDLRKELPEDIPKEVEKHTSGMKLYCTCNSTECNF